MRNFRRYNFTSLRLYILTSIYPFILMSLHPYIFTYLHQYILSFLYPYIYTALHPTSLSLYPYILTSLHPYILISLLYPYILASLHLYIIISFHPHIFLSLQLIRWLLLYKCFIYNMTLFSNYVVYILLLKYTLFFKDSLRQKWSLNGGVFLNWSVLFVLFFAILGQKSRLIRVVELSLQL